MKKIALVQGASRGLGFGLTRSLLQHASVGQVFASCRDPNNANQLHDLKNEYGDKLSIIKMDITDETQIENAKREIAQQAANIDLLINVAGILRVDTSIKTIKYEDVLESYKTNTIGPLLVAKHFYDLLQKKKLSGDESFEQAAMSVLANISAKAGSIGENTVGGWTSQRSTKAALNMITKNEALEFRSRGIVCVSLDPGIVETEMSAPYRKAFPKTISADDASTMLLKIIFNLRQQDNGKFFSYEGTELKW